MFGVPLDLKLSNEIPTTDGNNVNLYLFNSIMKKVSKNVKVLNFRCRHGKKKAFATQTMFVQFYLSAKIYNMKTSAAKTGFRIGLFHRETFCEDILS